MKVCLITNILVTFFNNELQLTPTLISVILLFVCNQQRRTKLIMYSVFSLQILSLRNARNAVCLAGQKDDKCEFDDIALKDVCHLSST